MENLIIHNIKYTDISHTQAIANITYPPVNGDEPFCYFILLNNEDHAPIHDYLRAQIDSGNLQIDECDEDTLEVRASAIREQRDSLLNETDKYMTIDYPISEEDRELIRAYRQALRDVPQQEGFPENVVWPEKPDIIKQKNVLNIN